MELTDRNVILVMIQELIEKDTNDKEFLSDLMMELQELK